MKTVAVVLSLFLVSHSFALNERPQTGRNHYFIKQVTYINPNANRVGADLCPTCIQFTDQAIDVILNIILQGGVVGTCGTLCQKVADKTGSQALGAVCNILCDIVGVEEFAKLVQEADLDPIYFCENLKVCPINDNGDAKITSLAVVPSSGPQGEFQINLNFKSNNGTGTGQIFLEVVTVDHMPVESAFLAEAAPAGSYNATFNLKAEPDPDCDPTQQPCEEWVPGDYTVKLALCNGECGSKHPHSQIYDEATTNFTITN